MPSSVPLETKEIKKHARQIVAAWLEAQSQNKSMSVNENSNYSHQKARKT